MSNLKVENYFPKQEARIRPSRFLYQADNGNLFPCHIRERSSDLYFRSKRTQKEIANLLLKENYPCIGALRSFHRNEYQVGLYPGTAGPSRSTVVRNDLLYFLERQKETQSSYLSFWAVFDETRSFSENEFEQWLWSQLSSLTSDSLKKTDWPQGADADPESKSFSFCIGGHELFVVGLHCASSRLSRRFPWPTLIFNSFDQFNLLKQKGHFNKMVEINRSLDEKFQGTANPMAVQWGEKWEAIQFSGKENPPTWKCPFHIHMEKKI